MEGWGVGDTHFTGSHIGGIHISLGICVRGYTYHGDTHITVTAVVSMALVDTSYMIPIYLPLLRINLTEPSRSYVSPRLFQNGRENFSSSPHHSLVS